MIFQEKGKKLGLLRAGFLSSRVSEFAIVLFNSRFMCEGSCINRGRFTRMSVLADRASVLGDSDLLIGRAGLGSPPPVADRPVGPAACTEKERARLGKSIICTYLQPQDYLWNFLGAHRAASC